MDYFFSFLIERIMWPSFKSIFFIRSTNTIENIFLLQMEVKLQCYKNLGASIDSWSNWSDIYYRFIESANYKFKLPIKNL